MCKSEYIHWYTKGCPSYLMLNVEAAKLKWKKDLADLSIPRDEVLGNDEDGNPTGWAA